MSNDKNRERKQICFQRHWMRDASKDVWRIKLIRNVRRKWCNGYPVDLDAWRILWMRGALFGAWRIQMNLYPFSSSFCVEFEFLTYFYHLHF